MAGDDDPTTDRRSSGREEIPRGQGRYVAPPGASDHGSTSIDLEDLVDFEEDDFLNESNGGAGVVDLHPDRDPNEAGLADGNKGQSVDGADSAADVSSF